MVRKSTSVELLQKKAVKLVTLARKDERHYNYDRACEFYEEALVTLATAIYYNAESRDCKTRAHIRANLERFVDYLVETSNERREDQLRTDTVVSGYRMEDDDRSILSHLKRKQEDLLDVFQLNPANLRRKDEKMFISLVSKKSKEFEDTLAVGSEIVIEEKEIDE